MNEKKYTNALAEEDSLYLQQHAHNPVNWLPWGDEAKQKAKDQNKLMLVSIGYSSCHWCHVMERESFEDEEVAELMNRNFVCIKVDREERPDVDQIYMEAVQMMSGQGGWPLNCFTNPLGEPVYGGTYFPKEQWMKVLDQLAQLWKDEPEKVNDYGRKLREGMKVTGVLPDPGADPDFPKSSLSETIANWKKRFDNERGGPNKAPKFPLPSNYSFLMKYARITEDSRLENHVRLTLDRMSIGGIYDQVGGGFTRYSTDPDWKVPHFEKMLYDNAQLLELYSEAFGAYKDPEYAHTARGIINWLRREMKNPEGGYYSAIDADSEGEEGKFYTWEESITEEVDLYGKYYHSDHRAMWEGKLIPVRKATLEELSKVYEMPLDEMEEEFDSLNLELLKKRQKRVRPATDDKSLCSWNAMLVSGFAAAYEFLGEEDYLNEAKNILSFIDKAYFSPDEVSLKHTWKNGNAKVDGFLEDYAFLIRALLKLYQISFDQNLLSRAKELTFQTLDRFYDEKSGIFYFTSNQQDDLVARPMELSDNVIPSSNSVMAANLLELSAHFGLSHFEKCSLRLLKAVEKGMIEYGSGYSNWAEIWLKKTLGSPELVVSGPDALAAIQRIEGYYPMLLKAATESESNHEIFKGRYSNEETRFFVCKNHSCNRPTLSAKETESELQKAYRQN